MLHSPGFSLVTKSFVVLWCVGSAGQKTAAGGKCITVSCARTRHQAPRFLAWWQLIRAVDFRSAADRGWLEYMLSPPLGTLRGSCLPGAEHLTSKVGVY